MRAGALRFVPALAIAAFCGTVAMSETSRVGPRAPVQLPQIPSAHAPMMADAFVDSIGVNTNLIIDLTADREYALIVARMQQLGIRHVRDSIYPHQTPSQNGDERRFFAATGTDLLAITDCPKPLGYFPGSQTPPSVIRKFDDETGHHIALLEGPNEPDLRKVRDWAPLTRACVARDDRHQGLTVPYVAPALGDPLNAPKLGDIAKLVDLGGIHRYFSGRKPGTDGFAYGGPCGRWEAIKWSICEARINAGPTAPLFITETGYTTFGEIDEKTFGKYLSRVLFVDSLAGIARTYVYELHDQGTDPKNSEDGFGLLRYDGTPKPAFFALRAIAGLLADPGPPFSLTPLGYSVSGPASVRNELLEKRDGSYFIAIWNEVDSWDPYTNKEIYVPPASVTLTFERAPHSIEYRALDDAGLLRSLPLKLEGNRAQIEVDDHVGFLRLK